MWTRKQLKDRAKASFYRNRWRTTLVSLITLVFIGAAEFAASTVGGGGSMVVGRTVIDSSSDSIEMQEIREKPDLDSGETKPDIGTDGSMPEMGSNGAPPDADTDRAMPDADSEYTDNEAKTESYHYKPDKLDFDDYYGIESIDTYSVEVESVSSANAYILSGVVLLLAFLGLLVVCVLVFAVIALIVNPLLVGCRRFFFINLNTPARVGELGYGFDTEYKNIAWIMFRKMMYTLLWSALFVVPGIVKSYEYMMIPYILAEEPGIDRKRAFAISKEMMKGHKWQAFILDMSFIPWNLLSSITFGIVGVLYVSPYKNMTYAAFYEQMRSIYTQKKMAAAQGSFDGQRSWNEVREQGTAGEQNGVRNQSNMHMKYEAEV